MEQTRAGEDLVRRYLLGELSASEQAALEDEYFLKQANYDQLCRAEDELIDQYVRGLVSASDRERFERSYLTNPRRREHVRFARALVQVVDETMAVRRAAAAQPVERPAGSIVWPLRLLDVLRSSRIGFALTLAAGALVIVVVGAWSLIETSRLRSQLELARQEQTQKMDPRIADLEAESKRLNEERIRLQAELEAAKASSPPSPLFTSRSVFFALSIGAVRDSGSPQPGPLIIPRGAEDVRLRVSLQDHDAKDYQVKLLTADGREVISRTGVRARAAASGAFLMLRLPAQKFVAGDNVLAVSGRNAAGEVETLGKVIIKVEKR